jgi:hypothetical protein
MRLGEQEVIIELDETLGGDRHEQQSLPGLL